jgi:hypothetical protein
MGRERRASVHEGMPPFAAGPRPFAIAPSIADGLLRLPRCDSDCARTHSDGEIARADVVLCIGCDVFGRVTLLLVVHSGMSGGGVLRTLLVVDSGMSGGGVLRTLLVVDSGMSGGGVLRTRFPMDGGVRMAATRNREVEHKVGASVSQRACRHGDRTVSRLHVRPCAR